MKTFAKLVIYAYRYTQGLRTAMYASMGISSEACRHQPSCSQYALECLNKHGTIQGTWLALKRLSSCRP